MDYQGPGTIKDQGLARTRDYLGPGRAFMAIRFSNNKRDVKVFTGPAAFL